MSIITDSSQLKILEFQNKKVNDEIPTRSKKDLAGLSAVIK
jgi:hypothetical protein